MRQLCGERAIRSERLEALPDEVVPEAKITEATSTNRSNGLHPIVLIIDEPHLDYSVARGDEFKTMAEDLVRLGHAVGISVINSTQVADADSIPGNVIKNSTVKFAFRAASRQHSRRPRRGCAPDRSAVI